MTTKLQPPINEINGFTVREIFVKGQNGEYIFKGYGVFDPEGSLIRGYPSLDDALAYLKEIAEPRPEVEP